MAALAMLEASPRMSSIGSRSQVGEVLVAPWTKLKACGANAVAANAAATIASQQPRKIPRNPYAPTTRGEAVAGVDLPQSPTNSPQLIGNDSPLVSARKQVGDKQ